MDINNSSSGYQNLLAMLGKSVASTTGALNGDSSQTAESGEAAAAGQSRSAAPAASQINADSSDKVSFSYRAEKLSRISAEFFSGTINSSQIPALTQRLYEDGFLSNSDFQALGGQTQQVSAIAEASNFLNSFILNEAVDGDSEAAKSLLNVVDVIGRMDERATPAQRRAETEAFDYVANYTDLLKEAGAPDDIVAGFENVLDVLTALDTVRKNEQSTGALASYASVQEAYNDLYSDEN
ncbi:hypothetical protein [Thalassolituus alkanivorans]|uniref:hypothetical protein n=1 Tax=Thalassolituus alkanivorans TaxID=2881055 RepID=UPI001E640298|nr:hypothetical protein [Thalassolituus alkanivorans]MCB2388238.1 hypothetical protein [Thalassolituus alkanivorans]MCB2424048.1 hypothetical protein [Thalassolituus alkanivorans]